MLKLDFVTLAMQYPGLKSFIYTCMDHDQPEEMLDLLFALETTETYGGGN